MLIRVIRGQIIRVIRGQEIRVIRGSGRLTNAIHPPPPPILPFLTRKLPLKSVENKGQKQSKAALMSLIQVLQDFQISESQPDNKLLINLNIFITNSTDFSVPLR